MQRLDITLRDLKVRDEGNIQVYGLAPYEVVVIQHFLHGVFRDVDNEVHFAADAGPDHPIRGGS